MRLQTCQTSCQAAGLEPDVLSSLSLSLLFSLHLKAPVWSPTKDNARCSMLTKAPPSLMTQRKRETKEKSSLSLSHYVQMKPRTRTTLKWRVEWAHVFEEVLNDNNNALRGRGQARNNFRGGKKKKKKKAFVVLWEKRPREEGTEREREKWRAEDEERWGCSIQTGNSSRKSWPVS